MFPPISAPCLGYGERGVVSSLPPSPCGTPADVDICALLLVASYGEKDQTLVLQQQRSEVEESGKVYQRGGRETLVYLAQMTKWRVGKVVYEERER